MDPLESLFRALADASDDAVLLADGAGRIRYVNDSCQRLFGYRREELVGETLALLRASWQARADDRGQLVDYRGATGEIFRARTTFASLRDASGRVIGRGATIRPLRGPSTEVVSAAEMERRRRDNMLAALRAVGFKITGQDGAAAKLGLAPSTLRSQMRALGIERPSA